MGASSGLPGGGRIGGKVIACGIAILLAAAFAMRAVEGALAGDIPAAASQGVAAGLSAIAAYALWVRMRRASDERVKWEVRAGRRDAGGRLRGDGDDDA